MVNRFCPAVKQALKLLANKATWHTVINFKRRGKKERLARKLILIAVLK